MQTPCAGSKRPSARSVHALQKADSNADLGTSSNSDQFSNKKKPSTPRVSVPHMRAVAQIPHFRENSYYTINVTLQREGDTPKRHG